MRNLLLLGIVLALFMIPGVMASSTQQYNKIYLNPFYRDSMTQNTNYTYSVSVIPPIKTKVASAIIGFDVYMNPTVTFNIYVNGQPCATPSFAISTTYSGANQARLTFDCSNVMTTQGTYMVTLRSNKNTGSITGWLDVAYSTNPEIPVHGTEYSINETSNYTIFVQVPNENSAVCEYKIFNTTRQLVKNGVLQYIPSSDGLYDTDFSNPNGNNPIVAGVYRTQAVCAIPIVAQNQTMYFNYTPEYVLGEDHVLRNNSGIGGDYESLTNVGTTEVCIDGGTVFWEDTVDFPTRPNYINFISDIVGYWRTGSGNTTSVTLKMKFNKYNLLSKTSTLLNTSTLAPVFMNTVIQQYNYSTVSINEQFAEYEILTVDICAMSNTTRTMRFYHSSNPSRFTREIGAINLSVSFLYRGSGEIHVSSPVTVSVNASAVNYTYFDGQFNQTNNLLGGVNTSLSGQITATNSSLSDQISSLFSYLTQIPSLVWNYTIRTLTTYGVQNNTYNFNNTVIYNNTQTINVTVNNTNTTYLYNNTQVLNVTVNNTNSTTIINNTYPVTVEVVNQTVNVTNAIVYNMTVNVTTQNVTVVNQTVDFTNVTNAISNLDSSMAANFTYTNGLITSVNGTVNYWGAMNNDTTTYWGTINQNETMYWGSLNYNTTTYWGGLNYNLTNYWGGTINLQLYNLTVGNVSVNATVDYDEIALTVMSYLISVDSQKSEWGLI